MNKPKNINLLISPVGDTSLHKEWLKGAPREFDIMLVYYGEVNDRYREDADYYLRIQGMFKLEAIASAINRSLDIVKRYKAVILPDDDIKMCAKEINKIFRVFHRRGLDLAQPSIKGGTWNYRITQQNRYCILRYVSFVEMMAPVFRTDILIENLHTFMLSRSGWGVDYLWSKNLKDKKLAIIDSVGIIHGVNKPSGERDYYRNLRLLGIDPSKELDSICIQYKCDLKGRMIEYLWVLKPLAVRACIYCAGIIRRISASILSRTRYGRYILVRNK